MWELVNADTGLGVLPLAPDHADRRQDAARVGPARGGRLRGHDQATSEDSSGEIANPPPEGLNLEISCPVESLVVAEGFSSTKLPKFGQAAKFGQRWQGLDFPKAPRRRL